MLHVWEEEGEEEEASRTGRPSLAQCHASRRGGKEGRGEAGEEEGRG